MTIGGSPSNGGTTSSGGRLSLGGTSASGGRFASVDTMSSGGRLSLGGTSHSSDTLSFGGMPSLGGAVSSGGRSSFAGSTGSAGLVAAAGSAGGTAVAPAGGPVDLNGYCISIGYTGATLVGATAYGWYCRASGGNLVGISVTAACRWQYGRTTMIDQMGNFVDPYSWACWDKPNELGRPELNGYCQAVGHQGAILVGSTAADWRCYTSVGYEIPIDMRAACDWTYDVSDAIDRVLDYFNPKSWSCWR